MSPRAACRLEALGFEAVYDYVPGKVDWLAHGLVTEGEKAGELRAGDIVRDDVVRAGLHERMGDVRGRVEASPYGFAFVVSDAGCLLGRLRKAALQGAHDATAEDVMEPGPATIRFDTPLRSLVERLRARDLQTAVVTTPEGTLIGVVARDEAESALAG